jgi:hypothetical protein
MLSKYSHGSLKIEVFLSSSSPHLQTSVPRRRYSSL